MGGFAWINALFRRKQQTPLRFYIYISETKVRMLFSQLPDDVINKWSTELKLSAPLIASATISTEGGRSEKSIERQVQILSAHIEKTHEIGDLANPKAFIGGTCLMRFGILKDYAQQLAFFGAREGGRTLALIGSADSVLGRVPSAKADHSPNYYALRFLNHWAKTEAKPYDQIPYEESYAAAFEKAFHAVPKRAELYEYLARVLYADAELTVATPLYIASGT